MATGTEAKITDEMIEELMKHKGVPYSPRYFFNKTASQDGLRHWVEGIGDPNPLFRDADYAKSTRWGGIINHPTFYFSTAMFSAPMGLPGIHALHTGTDWVFVKPLRVGDDVVVSESVHDIVEKEGRFAGRQFKQTWCVSYRNGNDEVTAVCYTHAMRTERDTAHEAGKYAGIEVHRYNEHELEEIDACYSRELTEVCRGKRTRYWDEVVVGEEIGPIVRGPLTVTDAIAFKTGWGWLPFCRTGWYAWDYRQRHPAAYPLNRELNVPDVPERVHWEHAFAKAIGAPAPYDYGPQRISWAATLMTHWASDEGWLKRLNIEVRRFNIVGDTTWVKGTVTGKRVEGGERVVDCDVWAENQDGVVTLHGTALVVLPPLGERGD